MKMKTAQLQYAYCNDEDWAGCSRRAATVYDVVSVRVPNAKQKIEYKNG